MEREVAPTRDPIFRPDSGVNISDTSFNNRTIPEIRPSIMTRDNGRVLSDNPPAQNVETSDYTDLNERIKATASSLIGVPWNPTYPANTTPSNQQAVASPSQPGTFYGTGDPSLVLSDIFRNVFGSGGDSGTPTQTGQSLVPVTSTSGGSSPILLIVILLAAGVGGYYLYKKYKSNA